MINCFLQNKDQNRWVYKNGEKGRKKTEAGERTLSSDERAIARIMEGYPTCPRQLAEAFLAEAKARVRATRRAVRAKALLGIDELTGMPKQAIYQKRAMEEIDRAMRYQRPLSIVMIDVDNFKNINDGRGHRAGDHVLQQVATIIQQNIRSSDFAARYAGDEFILILTETDAAKAALVAEKIRKAVEEGTDPRVTISMGCAEFENKGLLNNEGALQKAADEAAAKAKRAGRNRVEVYEPETGAKTYDPDEARADNILRSRVDLLELLHALRAADPQTAERQLVRAGILSEDPGKRVALLEALLAQAKKTQQEKRGRTRAA